MGSNPTILTYYLVLLTHPIKLFEAHIGSIRQPRRMKGLPSTGAIESVEVMVRVLLQERSWFVVGLLCCTKGGFWSQCAGLHAFLYF